MKTVTGLVALVIVLMAARICVAVDLNKGGKTDAEVNTEIVIRCQYQMGEFGSEAIAICVKAEHEAIAALVAYPEETAEIVQRCNRIMYKAGWAMIKACSDKDLAAQQALQAYPAEHQEVIDACREKTGRYGPAQVKKCVDKELGG